MSMVRRTFLLAIAASWSVASRIEPPTAQEIQAEKLNGFFAKWATVALGTFAGLPLLYRLISVLHSQLRLLVSLNSENQRYFATPSNELIPSLKKHVLYAPLFRVRHNREFQLSQAVNMGTLPTRFQTFFLVGYVATNILFCTYMIDYSDRDTMLRDLMKRTGVMAAVNMPPLFLLAGRNNPLLGLLGISFNSFNLIHRWLGRIVALEALAHGLSWIVGNVMSSGWESVKTSIASSTFILPGVTAACALTFILIHSPSALRHAFYETFLFFHIIAAAIVIGGLWYHLAARPGLERWSLFLKNAIAVWAIDRFLRIVKVLYRNFRNFGRNMTSATIEALPGDAARVTIRMPRPWKLKPGQHLYLYMPTLGLWTSHPFTITWSENEDHSQPHGEKLPMNRQDIFPHNYRTMSLIIRRRTGFTNTLFKKAFDSPRKTFTATAFVEGPYGKISTFGSYGTVILIAGGVGITHPVPYIKELIEGYSNGTIATRRVTLVWVIQTPEHLEWIRPWMTKILAMEKRREILKIQLFVTRPKSTKEVHSPSATVQMFPGRPNFNTLLNMEIESKMGSIAVSVCGSGSMSDDVRAAVRAKQHTANIDFFEEAFSW